jgi:hypothetical protein
MKEKSAKGLKGILIIQNNEPYLRIPADNEDGFEDIRVDLEDMDIQILDDDAFIKEKSSIVGPYKILDYSNRTLGIEDDNG